MPTLYGNVYFNSGNVNSLVTNLDNSSLIPNRSYTITLNGIDHMKGYGIKSNLSDSYSDNITGYTTPITFFTPADNVESVIDLVRKTDTTISVYVHSLSSPNYGNLTYNGTLRRYTNSGLTGETTDIATYTNLPKHVGDYSIPNLLTQPYYFASEFENTHGVVKESNRNTVQKNQIFDIRGLAYFRDNLYTYIDIIDSPSIIRPSNGVLTEDNTIRHALSADGSVLLVSFGNVLDVYKHRKKIDSYSFQDFQELFNLYARRYYYSMAIGTAIAISGDASRCVVAFPYESNILKVINLNKDLTFNHSSIFDLTVPYQYVVKIHNVCMSMDGKAILISGSLNNYREGYAHVYRYYNGEWSEPTDLSSSMIPGYSTQYSYGTDSCLSGDGKMIAIFGASKGDGLDTGYIWKSDDNFNWEFLKTVSLGKRITARIAPCSMSYDGNILVVTAPADDRWVLFMINEDYMTIRNRSIQDELPFMVPGSISGDGKTVVFASKNNDPIYPTIEVYVHTLMTGVWNGSKTFQNRKYILNNVYVEKVTTVPVDSSAGTGPGLNALVSFDGGVVMIGSIRIPSGSNINNNIITHINGKTGATINAVLDYMNTYYNTLRFPFSTDKVSTDGSVAFTDGDGGGGTIIDNSLNLGYDKEESLDLGSSAFQFRTDKGFVVEFDAIFMNHDYGGQRAINISNGMFHCEIYKGQTANHSQTMHVKNSSGSLAIAFSTSADGSWTDFKNFKYMYSHETNTARTYMNGVETGNVSGDIPFNLNTPTNVNMSSYTGIKIKNLTFRVTD